MLKKSLLILIITLFYSCITTAQISDFPKSWEGNWKGEISIYSLQNTIAIPVSLSIQALDKDRWSWTLHYEVEGQMPRLYELIKEDSNWKIDEKNGIILPQTIIANRLVSSFSVMGNLLSCYYWLENDALHMEIHVVKLEPNTQFTLNNDESTVVSNHLFSSFQKAILHRK